MERTPNLPNGIVLIDKPKGLTSFDVIRVLRKKLGVRKIGHAGTLDPLATGLLVVGIGKGTKELANLVKLPKEYVAEILLGVKTASGDREGAVLERRPVPKIDRRDVLLVLDGIKGTVELTVPRYSAVKVGGERLYRYAQRGEDVEAPSRIMEIREVELLDVALPILKVRMVVSSGTYVRSVAEEIGRRLGTVATLENLRRTRVGTFSVEDAERLKFHPTVLPR